MQPAVEVLFHSCLHRDLGERLDVRIRRARHRADPGGRVRGVTAAGEWAGQLGLRGADHKAQYGVECGEPVAVRQAGPPERADQRVGRGRRYVPIVGSPGSLAMVTAASAESGWKSTVPSDGHFDNRVAAADAVAMVMTSATRHARYIDAPLLVCVCDRENLMDPAYAALVARRAPRGVARHYDSDHFAIYHPSLVARVLTEQTAVLQEHLGVHA